jgi:single-strand DNA-binding protein
MLLGRLGADPVLRHTKNGTAVSQFSVATESWQKSKNETETTWHRVVAWGKSAEKVSEELKKGMPVLLEGGIRVRKYQDDEGEVHYSHEIHADRVNFLHPRAKTISTEEDSELTTDLAQAPDAIEATEGRDELAN